MIPIQREFVHAQIKLAVCYLDVMERIVEDNKKGKASSEGKSCIKLLIENFIQESVNLSTAEQRWMDLVK